MMKEKCSGLMILVPNHIKEKQADNRQVKRNSDYKPDLE